MLGWIEQLVTLQSSGSISVALDGEYKEGHGWVVGSRSFISFLPPLGS